MPPVKLLQTIYKFRKLITIYVVGETAFRIFGKRSNKQSKKAEKRIKD